MKKFTLGTVVVIVPLLLAQCTKDQMQGGEPEETILKGATLPGAVPGAMFEVTVENISTVYDYFDAGAQLVPDGASAAGPAFPGHSFTVKFHAGKGHRLSFASMYGASNDLYYAPSDEGITLFTGNTPTTGNITGMISLWDAGTEVNHAPGSGEDGAPESVVIKSLRNTDNVMDPFDYNNVEENIEVHLAYDGTSEFTLTIDVLPGSSTPLSPVAWVVHSDGQHPIFTEGTLDEGHGLEDLAETGNAVPLSNYLSMHSGYVSPIAPGVWVLHKQGEKPIFREGKLDEGLGLEMLSEVGDPSALYASLTSEGFEAGVYSIPDGAATPGPLFPGHTYTFTVEATVGEYLSFASMLGKSNDLFLAPGEKGIRLFQGRTPLSGEVTGSVLLWDAGTEVNEYPGAGIHQGPGGTDESEPVMTVNDGFTWPEASQVIRVTVNPL